MRAFYDVELPDRAARPLGEDRTRVVGEFVRACRNHELGSVLEVGCGAGRDGVLLREAGLRYVGVDTSPVGIALCRATGLPALLASATALPFHTDALDAAWTMSTLMHLPGAGMATALAELSRVVRPGGVIDVGVWGRTSARTEFDEHGRRFVLRTDDETRDLLAGAGELAGFATWDWGDGGFHYQWGRVVVR